MLEPCFHPFPLLETERLLLRRIVAGDLNELFTLRSNTEVMQYVGRPPATSTEDVSKMLQAFNDSLNNHEGVTWGITRKEENKLIGTIGFWKIAKAHYRAEIGYMLHPAMQGKGIMYEALQTVLDFGFSNIHLHSVEAQVDARHLKSINLLEKTGFVREAYLKENHFFEGRFLDTVIYSQLSPHQHKP